MLQLGEIIWKCLLVLLFIVVFWFSIDLFQDSYRYLRLSQSTAPIKLEWRVKELYSERFGLQSFYTFTHNGQEFHGSSESKEETFRNYWAAEKAIPDMFQKERTVWYHPDDPEMSTLDKSFPLKEFISTLVLWMIYIYFVGLRHYVFKLISKDQKERTNE